jgi:hypothetical protein
MRAYQVYACGAASRTAGMPEQWSPRLELHEDADRCRLSLAGHASGHGHSLQEAADDLIARLLGLALAVRTSGLAIARDAAPPDRDWLDYVWQLGELAARGEDIRERVFDPRFARP